MTGRHARTFASAALNAADLDVVTIDAYGTLLTIVDPFPRLEELLPGHGRDEIEHAFYAEADFYRAHAHTGHDESSLLTLREGCTRVFNERLGSSISVDEYVGALEFEPLPGVHPALERLRALGLSLAVVGNWDWSLHLRLEESRLAPFFATVVPAANKPSPQGILRALDHLRVEPSRALHVGDEPGDEEAARAARVHFAPAPLAEVVASIA
jgi:phosphoglycolate phosphatase-like HAD superfamily hydrolase